MNKRTVARRGLGVFLSMVLCFWMGTPVFAEEPHQKFRFKDHGSGTVTDHVTGLEWVKCPHVLSGNSRAMSWNRALAFFCWSVCPGGRIIAIPNSGEIDFYENGSDNGCERVCWSAACFRVASSGSPRLCAGSIQRKAVLARSSLRNIK